MCISEGHCDITSKMLDYSIPSVRDYENKNRNVLPAQPAKTKVLHQAVSVVCKLF
jgi:hypothetical protein